VVNHPHYAPQSEVLAHKVSQARELFETMTAGVDIQAEYLCVDWAVTGDSTVDILNFYAYQKDLIIVGQSGQDRALDLVPSDLPQRVVLGCGRPVLIVPYAGTFSSVGKRVLVAWKAGRASARAVHDAMPFLQKAEQVYAVTVTSPGDQPSAETHGDSGIGTHLKRHNILVREETLEAGDVPVDNILMNYAWEHGCDLLVMGVYAHTQRGSLAIGPVTKDFFERMTVPIFMSH
jgi:nucleotide-binding universal stress UspA family protein